MDNEITKWQELWQQQKANQIDVDTFTVHLLKLERISKFQRVLFFAASAFAIYAMLTHLSFNTYNMAAIAIIAIAMLIVLVPLFKNKLNRDNVNNQQYVCDRIEYLKRKLLIPKTYLLIFIVLFVLALNIAFIGAFKGEELFQRILFHASTIVLLGLLLISRRMGIRNYENEILPLINKLEKIKQQD